MKKTWQRFIVCSLCLATLLLAFGTPLKSYAATRTAHQPGDFCVPTDPINTGVSYDATSYDLIDNANESARLRFFSNASGIGISAWTCGVDLIVLGVEVSIDSSGANWINVETTFDGVTTVTAPLFSSVGAASDDLKSITTLLEEPHQQYTFRVQECYLNGGCTGWSPHLQIVLAANSYCQDGYVWRQADFDGIDHVCVQPWEAVQAAYDNSQTAARGNPDPTYPNACNPGYVWREAWGGDYVCVDPPQRQQVYDDNSQALNRIVAL